MTPSSSSTFSVSAQVTFGGTIGWQSRVTHPSDASLLTRSVRVLVEIGPSRRLSSPKRTGPSVCSRCSGNIVHGLAGIASGFAGGWYELPASSPFRPAIVPSDTFTLRSCFS